MTTADLCAAAATTLATVEATAAKLLAARKDPTDFAGEHPEKAFERFAAERAETRRLLREANLAAAEESGSTRRLLKSQGISTPETQRISAALAEIEHRVALAWG